MDQRLAKRRSGPRTFDRDLALDAAMRLFWRHGYEGTSLADLTQAMGIAPPSLYAAFGSKAGLYHEALNRYAAAPDMQIGVGDAETLKDAVRHLLRRAADKVTDPRWESGCMISFGLIEHGSGADDVALIAAERRREMGKRVTATLAPWLDDVAADRSGALLMAILGGMAIAARDGATRAELYRIADDASFALSNSAAGWIAAGSTPETRHQAG